MAEITNLPIPTDLKKKSNYYPLESRGHFVETFYELVLKDLRDLNSSNKGIKHGER